MTKTNIPIQISSVCVTTYNSYDDVARLRPGVEFFDDREDLELTLTQSGLGVLLTILNSRRLRGEAPQNIRRTLLIELINTADNTLVDRTELSVKMDYNDLIDERRVDFPFPYNSCSSLAAYKIVVRDKTSGYWLGEKKFNLINRVVRDNPVETWFENLRGGLMFTRYNGGLMFKQVQGLDEGVVIAVYEFRPDFDEKFHPIPEFEVRVYRPDGSLDSSFLRAECVNRDEHIYSISKAVDIMLRRGVYYVEFVCLDVAVAGFAFGSDGPLLKGSFTGEDLESLIEYSPEAAMTRYQAAKKAGKFDGDDEETPDDEAVPEGAPEDKSDGMTEEEFDAMLDRYIEVQKENMEEEVEEEEKEQEEEDEEEEAPDPDVLMPISNLVGLENVKKKLSTYECMVRFNRMRADHGLPWDTTPLHAMFLGSPGTGKTTVAKRMGMMLHRAGVLSKGHVVVRERSTLLGQFYSSEGENTLKALEEARGGILFIDEAYQLYQPDDRKDPGKFVIETLLSALADPARRDWMLILAGYSDEMRRMFEMNPGFKSRIPESNIYVFDDFSEEELIEIARRYIDMRKFLLSPEAEAALKDRLAADYAARDKSFGNARHVLNLIQSEILPAMAVRVMESGATDKETLTLIRACDIPAPVPPTDNSRPKIGFRA